jgi:hypothetical protein
VSRGPCFCIAEHLNNFPVYKTFVCSLYKLLNTVNTRPRYSVTQMINNSLYGTHIDVAWLLKQMKSVTAIHTTDTNNSQPDGLA